MPILPIYGAHGIREIETRASGARLMERAGAAAAELARGLCGDTAKSILVVAGPGNNGGDAFEAAAHLKRSFFRVGVVFAGDRDGLPADARAALAKWEGAGGTLLDSIPDGARFDLAIDGLFGIGLKRPLEGKFRAIVERLNTLQIPVLSLDVPSGLDADTGAVMVCAVRATHTLTFIAHKPGLLTLDGPDHCGALTLDSLGLDPPALLEPEGALLDAGILAAALAPRPRNFHKGNAGTVGVVGGAAGMVGAAVIAGRAALRCGAGRVILGVLAPHAPGVDSGNPELMLRTSAEVLSTEKLGALVVGPGMGKGDAARKSLRAALAAPAPLVLDADALNLISGDASLAAATAKRAAATVMTPHPAEAARLLGNSTRSIQSDRVAAAKAIAKRYRAFALLKGNGSVIADPDGRFWINPSGNPGMASAGMGDALAGMVGALCAQGTTPRDALLASTWLHGAAADALVAAGSGPVGITASEVIDSARALINAAR